MAPRLKLYFREPDVDTTLPIVTGVVGVPGFEVELVGKLKDADAWDCAFAQRLVDAGGAREWISVPAFPNRKFRLSSIYVNTAAGLRGPRDLEGRRVGVRFWPNTAGVWARGALRDFYGVDLAKIHWVVLGVDRDGAPPPSWSSELVGWRDGGRPESEDIDEMLVRGDLDAVIDANVLPSITRRDPRTARLIPDYVAEEKRYFRETGVFPTSHVVTLRRAFAEAHPDAPMALLSAFRHARNIAYDAIEGVDPKVIVVSWLSHFLEEQRALMGDNYYAYDVASSRKTLEALTDYAHQQGLTPRRVAVEELFHPSTLGSPDSRA